MEYTKGDQVNHCLYGLGTVLEVDEKTRGVKIKFDELQTIRTIASNFKGMTKGGQNEKS